jgi:Xaa-Pro aminopeptidase
MKKIIILFILISLNAFAQSPSLSPDFHRERREALREKMPENSVTVLVSNPQQKRSFSSTFKFKQNTDLYYFSGINEANVVLFVFKEKFDYQGQQVDEILFVSPKDPTKELWEGIMLGEEGAKKASSVNMVLSIKNLKDLAFIPENISIAFAILPEFDNSRDNQLLQQFVEKVNKKFASLNPKQMQSWLNQLRGVKTKDEIAVMREAINISGKGHIEAMKAIKRGVSERQVQAVHEFTQRVLGSDDAGYLPIIGADNNGCILHYHENSKANLKDRLILMDVGAEYKNYTGDITRTVPVNGKFNQEEKLIYQLVLNALEAGINAAKNGSSFFNIETACRSIIDQGLVDLGLINKGEKHNFFPHGVSHHLGLDVHDRGEYGKLKSGMIITVEPGIYIPDNSPVDKKWWGIGIRIEDNILITDNGNENLSAFVPKTIVDVEKIMGSSDLVEKIK